MNPKYLLPTAVMSLLLLGNWSTAKGDGKPDDILSRKDLFLIDEDPKYIALLAEIRNGIQDTEKKKQELKKLLEDSRQRALKRAAIREEMLAKKGTTEPAKVHLKAPPQTERQRNQASPRPQIR